MRQRSTKRQRWPRYLGPEHLLLGPLVQGDSLAARVLRAHGLDLQAVRAGLDRLVDQGVLPGPQPSDAELLATIGIDLTWSTGPSQKPSAIRPTSAPPSGCGCGRPTPFPMRR